MFAKVIKLAHLHRMQYGILAHGCFDLLHIGHIRYLKWARSLLPSAPFVVTLTADRFITKGEGRPAFDERVRAECLAALECVDYVSIIEDPTGLPAIHTLKPAVYAKGRDVEPVKMALERAAVEWHGGRVEFMPEPQEISSTEILTGRYLQKRIEAMTVGG